jgi:hypothetical protein
MGDAEDITTALATSSTSFGADVTVGQDELERELNDLLAADKAASAIGRRSAAVATVDLTQDDTVSYRPVKGNRRTLAITRTP